MTVAVFGTLRFPPENMAEVLPHLRALVEATRAKDGCVAWEIRQGDGTAPELPGAGRSASRLIFRAVDDSQS